MSIKEDIKNTDTVMKLTARNIALHIISLFLALYFLFVPVQNWAVQQFGNMPAIVLVLISTAILYPLWLGIIYGIDRLLKNRGH